MVDHVIPRLTVSFPRYSTQIRDIVSVLSTEVVQFCRLFIGSWRRPFAQVVATMCALVGDHARTWSPTIICNKVVFSRMLYEYIWYHGFLSLWKSIPCVQNDMVSLWSAPVNCAGRRMVHVYSWLWLPGQPVSSFRNICYMGDTMPLSPKSGICVWLPTKRTGAGKDCLKEMPVYKGFWNSSQRESVVLSLLSSRSFPNLAKRTRHEYLVQWWHREK